MQQRRPAARDVRRDARSLRSKATYRKRGRARKSPPSRFVICVRALTLPCAARSQRALSAPRQPRSPSCPAKQHGGAAGRRALGDGRRGGRPRRRRAAARRALRDGRLEGGIQSHTGMPVTTAVWTPRQLRQQRRSQRWRRRQRCRCGGGGSRGRWRIADPAAAG
eukprot:351305-Chlamydomonas_euryale.AAC.2